ncbi:MAG: FliH/SctL family protein [Candidatus Tyrphobacter sp.]
MRAQKDLCEIQAPPAQQQPQPIDAQRVRRFYAALADALDCALDDLMRDVASDVLARELALAPADVARLAHDALSRLASQEPLYVAVHRDDAGALAALHVPVRIDETLRRGDASIVLRYGSIDASLGARLQDVLAANAR